MKKELLIGCGSKRDRRLNFGDLTKWNNLTTLDYNPDHKPDVVHDLTVFPYPFKDNTFDEIHAYEVLEHMGAQGDYKFFFAQFTEFWRILKPGGLFMAVCPSRHSEWAWGDPSHTRILQKEQLVFLSQKNYEEQVGVTPMSDFRHIYKADYEIAGVEEDENKFVFALRAKK